MLLHHSYYCGMQSALSLLEKTRAAIDTYHEYQPYENLNSWRIPSHPDLVLMEGRKVKPHDDGGRFWQPFLVLNNPGDSYSFRSPRQPVRNLSPHAAGALLILDIGKQHQATGHSRKAWSVLCWNPNCCVPHQDDYTLEAVVEAAKKAFNEFMVD